MTEHASLAAALCAAEAEMPNAVLDKMNPHFKNRYASLESLREASLPSLTKHGLSISHEMDIDNWGFFLRAVLCHDKTDEKRFSRFPLPDAPDKPQVLASAITYGRRYTWAALVAIASEEDDDGERATTTSGKTKSAYQARKDGFYPIAQEAIRGAATLTALKEWWHVNQPEITKLPPKWRELLDEEKDRRKLELVDELGMSGSPLMRDLTESLKLSEEEAAEIDPPSHSAFLNQVELDDLDRTLAEATDEHAMMEVWQGFEGIKGSMPPADQDKAQMIFERRYRGIKADSAIKLMKGDKKK